MEPRIVANGFTGRAGSAQARGKARVTAVRKSILMMVAVLLGLAAPLAAKDPIPAAGENLPELVFAAPEDPGQRQYLGLGYETTFTVKDVDARILIIEIFSMYCPYCQREAGNVNALYGKIAKNPKLKSAVKIMGIGAGNSDFEVDLFRKTYKIAFPLFSDGNFAMHAKLGEVRTPYFFAVLPKSGGGNRIIYSKLGTFGDPEAFLKTLLNAAGPDAP